ncbi:sulfite reductase [Rhodobacterales bacterium 59_46_T64]|nr:sulfite reductase [Rhodobacterales bacterium 59_46_T64]
MARPFTPKVVTANALLEGDVIYQCSDDSWTRDLRRAELLMEADTAAARLARAETQHHAIVGPYLTDMAAGENGPEPVHFREDFRRTGPSNYAHGKQVELS